MKHASSQNYNGQNPSKTIRQRLDDLCKGADYPFNHPTKFEGVFFPEFENELQVLINPPPPDKQYNCFAYALVLTEWVHTHVINKAIQNHDLKTTSKPNIGDIAVYFEGSEKYIRHGARYISENQVSSKWAGGPVFVHSYFMCPLQYGDQIKFYQAISKEEAQILVNKYPVPNK